MADEKITQKTALTTPAGGDLLYIVDDPSVTPVGKKITLTNLFTYAPGTVDLTDITDNNIPYMGASGFADSPIKRNDSRSIILGDGTSNNQSIFFDDGSDRILQWEDSEDRFRFSAKLVVEDNIKAKRPTSGSIFFQAEDDAIQAWFGVSALGVGVGGTISNHDFEFRTDNKIAFKADSLQEMYFPSISSGTENDLNYNTATGQIVYVSSSERFKENIDPLMLDTTLVYDLQPRSFNWRDMDGIAEETKGKRDFGLIAEEVEKVYPELVTYDGEGRPAGVRYKMLTVLLLEEMKNIRKKL